MSAFKVFNLLAVTTLALLVTSFGATPVNALAHGGHHLNRQIHHPDVAKRGKRANVKRCKQRPTSSLAATTPTATTPAPTTPAATPQPSTTEAPATTSAPSSGGSNGGGVSASGKKLMIAWNNPDPSKLALAVGPNTGAVYTWSVFEPPNTFGAEFFPEFWGAGKVGEFQQHVTAGKYQDILFYNEPDQGGQSNIDPWTAAANWKTYMEPLGAAGARLWTPAVTSSPDGETWMDNFMNACSGCNIYGVAVHWYGTDPQQLISFVKKWQGKYGGKPLALTEFACQDFSGQGHVASMDEIWGFYKTVMPFLMGPSGPVLVAPFGFLEDMGNVNPNNQMLRGGALTDLGNYIVYGPY